MPPLALAEGGKALLELGRVVITVAKRGGLKTFPVPLPIGTGKGNKVQVKAKDADPKDCRRVLRFCDADGCVTHVLSDPLMIERMAGSFVADLLTGDLFRKQLSVLQFIADECHKCFATEVLNKDRPKVKTKRYRAFSRRTGGYAKPGQGKEPLRL